MRGRQTQDELPGLRGRDPGLPGDRRRRGGRPGRLAELPAPPAPRRWHRAAGTAPSRAPAGAAVRPERTGRASLAASEPTCNHHYMTTEEQQGGSAAEKLRGWFGGRMPADWFTAAPEIKVDREEITVIGALESPPVADGASAAEQAAAASLLLCSYSAPTRHRRYRT